MKMTTGTPLTWLISILYWTDHDYFFSKPKLDKRNRRWQRKLMFCININFRCQSEKKLSSKKQVDQAISVTKRRLAQPSHSLKLRSLILFLEHPFPTYWILQLCNYASFWIIHNSTNTVLSAARQPQNQDFSSKMETSTVLWKNVLKVTLHWNDLIQWNLFRLQNKQ